MSYFTGARRLHDPGPSREVASPRPLASPDPGAPSALSRPYATAEDVDLVRLVVAGSQPAFEELVERYQGRIFRLVCRFVTGTAEVEDIVQDVFIKVYRRIETFTFQASFYTWLYRIAVNTASDALSKRRRSPVRSVEDPSIFSGEGPAVRSPKAPARGEGPPEENLMEEELREVTRSILATIPEKFRTVLILREYEDLSYEEMAQVLGISIGTVESRLFRARARFKDKMLRQYPSYYVR
ncbi:MAG: sigma-70 family RNA polymerase sigma factor [Planctomycetes bacterium]|nr:sigma-70 family RNA polymerase sigma factor [Planctomycetota bacterium]